MQNTIKKFFKRKKLWWLLCYPLAILSLSLSKKFDYIAEEVFAKRIFKFLSQAVSLITGILPFSLAEICILIGPIVLASFFLVWFIKMLKKREDKFYSFMNGILNLILAVGVILFVYVLGCGVNYYRYPFSYYSDLTVIEASKEELYDLCMDLASRTNVARESLTSACENEEGVYTLSISIRELGKKTQEAFKVLSQEYPILLGKYPRPKRILFSRFMSKMEITGIFIPFTMEANVNIDISDYSIASTMCHELAHLHGFIREDEANYISYLACTYSEDPDLIYSGLMEALIISGNALYSKDRELYYKVRATYSDAVLRDLVANSVYWKEFENTVVSAVANKVNDTYLKANNQEDGVQSYGRMVDLLLAEYRKKQK